MKRTYSQIDLDERRKIARWRQAGVSVEVIAEKLGRQRSTIFREIARSKFEDVRCQTLPAISALRLTARKRIAAAIANRFVIRRYARRSSNGSSMAAREVVIVTVEPDADSRAKESVTEVAAFLAHHGIKARTEVVTAKDESGQLYKMARSLHADTIVSGAYGHSRMREWIFGGVTRSLLEDNGLNRFMSN